MTLTYLLLCGTVWVIHGGIDDAGAADRAEVQAPLSHGDVSSPQSGGYAGRMASLGQSLLRLAGAALKSVASRQARSRTDTPDGGRTAGRTPTRKRTMRRRPAEPAPRRPSTVSYDPRPGDTADPGEIVWTWVPYEDDPRQGKDRPVLVIGRDGAELLGLMLTSRDRNNARNRHEGYVDIGSGPWDSRGRPSEVYLERVLRIDEQDVRRIGATLERPLFDMVLSRLGQSPGR